MGTFREAVNMTVRCFRTSNVNFLFHFLKLTYSISPEPDWSQAVATNWPTLQVYWAVGWCLKQWFYSGVWFHLLTVLTEQWDMTCWTCFPQTVNLASTRLWVRLVWPQECLLDAVRWPGLSHAAEWRQLGCGACQRVVWAALGPTRWKGLLLKDITN